ncbi:MAG: hypothetical protein R3C68_15330 [Myxococcota bacterium]
MSLKFIFGIHREEAPHFVVMGPAVLGAGDIKLARFWPGRASCSTHSPRDDVGLDSKIGQVKAVKHVGRHLDIDMSIDRYPNIVERDDIVLGINSPSGPV